MNDFVPSQDFEEKIRAAAGVPLPDAGFVAGLRAELIARASQASRSRRGQFRNRLQGAISWGLGLAALGALVALLVFSFRLIPGNGSAPLLGGSVESSSTEVPTARFTPAGEPSATAPAAQFTPTGQTWPTSQFTPTAVTTPLYPVVDPASLHPLLGELYALKQRWEYEMLSGAGWLHQSFRINYPEAAGALANGAQIPGEYLLDDWGYIDGQGKIATIVSRMVDLNGQILQTGLYRDGVWRNLTFSDESWYIPRPAGSGLDYGFSDGAALSLKSGEGQLSKQSPYDDGQYTGDLYRLDDSQGILTEALFDPQTGQLSWLKVSLVKSGQFEQIASVTVLVEERASEPPADVLALIE